MDATGSSRCKVILHGVADCLDLQVTGSVEIGPLSACRLPAREPVSPIMDERRGLDAIDQQAGSSTRQPRPELVAPRLRHVGQKNVLGPQRCTSDGDQFKRIDGWHWMSSSMGVPEVWALIAKLTKLTAAPTLALVDGGFMPHTMNA